MPRCDIRSPLTKTLYWDVEMLGRECNSTGICIHFNKTRVASETFGRTKMLLTPDPAGCMKYQKSDLNLPIGYDLPDDVLKKLTICSIRNTLHIRQLCVGKTSRHHALSAIIQHYIVYSSNIYHGHIVYVVLL